MVEVNKIFKFLKEFSSLRHKPVSDVNNQLWKLWLNDLPKVPELQHVFNETSLSDGTILIVTRPELLPCPKPPRILLEWLEDGWQSLRNESVLYKEYIEYPEINDEQEDIIAKEYFADDTQRVKASDEWLKERLLWYENQKPKERVYEFYTELYRLYSLIKKEPESVELVFGDANLMLNTTDVYCHHPLLLQKAKVVFDQKKPSFKVVLDETPIETYSALLRSISLIDQKMLSEVMESVENSAIDINQSKDIEKMAKQLAAVIDKNAIFNVGQKVEKNPNVPQVYTTPILMLRKKTLGYESFINDLIKDIEQHDEENIPSFFKTLVGKHIHDEPKIIKDSYIQSSGIDKEVLLTLPANQEQLRIIKLLNNYGSVLVQGPPGTGKTHSIVSVK